MTDKLDSAKEPSQGAIKAARGILDLINEGNPRLRTSEMADLIDRETKAGEMAESLKWALGNISKPRLIKGQNDEHVAAYDRAERLLTDLYPNEEKGQP